jgi:heat shock protein HslJ
VNTYLSVVLDVDGEAQALTPVKLGDRSWFNGPISIENNRLIVPFSTMTTAFDREFMVQDFQLIERPHAQALVSEIETPLEATLWHLTEYINAAGNRVPAQIFFEQPTIQFRGGRIDGMASCNRFFGTYRLDDSALSLQLGGITTMACPDDVEAQEQAVLAALQQVEAYGIANGKLQLFDGEGKRWLTFEQAPPLTLTNTLWQLVGYNNGHGGVVSVMPDITVTARFDDNSRLTGFGGCNNYIADYTFTENTVVISPSISTRKFCGRPDGIMAQESNYLQVLETATTFNIEGDTLTLVNESSATVARFRAVDTIDEP